jgi:hypothetical protein
MRQTDISFALTIVLHALSPPASKTSPVTAQNIKSASEMRAGSITFGNREQHKRLTPIPLSLFKVGLLGKFSESGNVQKVICVFVYDSAENYDRLL